MGAAIFSMFFFLSLYLQGVLRYSPLKTGICYLPLALSIMVSAGVTQSIATRIGVRRVLGIVASLALVGRSSEAPGATALEPA